MQDFRNISPMSDLAWSGVGFPPLFLCPNVRKRKQPKAQNRSAPGVGRGRGSIIINLIMMEKQESFSAIRACPGICVCDSSAGTDSTSWPNGSTGH